MQENKKCSVCGNEYPATFEYFYLRTNGRLRAMCKKCKNEQDKEYSAKNREQINKRRREYYSRNKEKINARRKELRNSVTPAKRRQIKERARIYYRDNKARLKKQVRDYQKTEKGRLVTIKAKHKRRTVKSNLPATLTLEDWEKCLSHFGYKCAYCGMSENEHLNRYGEKLHQEHFVPLSKGGGYTRDNIIPACKSCNCEKSNSSFFDWYPASEGYKETRRDKVLHYLSCTNGG